MGFRQLLPVTRHAKVLVYAIILGVAVGYISTGYRWAIQFLTEFFRRTFASSPINLTFLMPISGSLVLILILYFMRAEIREFVPEVIESSIRNTHLRVKDGIVCFVTSLMTLASGGSAGPEGPMAFTGSAVGSSVGRLLHMDNRHAKIFLAAGAAAGIASIFNAPLAGVLFALELILLNDLTMSAVTPVILASVAASAVTFNYLGDRPTFVIPPFAMNSHLELFAYSVLGVAGGFVSVFFCRAMSYFNGLFPRLKMGRFTPLAGSLVVGVILMGFPQIGGYGHDYITKVLHGQETLLVVACLVFFKVIGTALTLQSGNSGGIFAPALLIGASLGATLGYILHYFVPGAGPVGSYATIGMAAVMAGTIHTPLTAMMLIFEVTRDYHTILPLMTATVISTLVAYGMGSDSLYLAPLKEKHLDFRHIRDLGALADVHSVELMRTHFKSIHPDDSAAEIRARFKQYPYRQVVFMDRDHTLKGYIPIDTFHLLDNVPLDELAMPFPEVVHPLDTLYETLRKLRHTEGLLPVVDQRNRVLGIISNKIFIEKYLPLLKVFSAKRSGI